MIQNRSWMDANNMNESKLRHCLNQFDLWEYLIRKVAIEFPRKQNIGLGEQYIEMQKTFDEEIDWMNKVTDQGNNSQVVDSIAYELAKKLTCDEVDPRDILRDLYLLRYIGWVIWDFWLVLLFLSIRLCHTDLVWDVVITDAKGYTE